MSTITRQPPSPAADWIPKPLARLTVDQYEALVDSGVFAKRDRLHLINGLLVTKVTKNPPRVLAADLTGRALQRVVSPGWWIRIEAPVCLPPKSEPEPGVSMARGNNLDYGDHHPGPGDLALVVEVAYSSLDNDRDLVVVYGPAGIPVYWIVNLIDQQVEMYTDPRQDGYGARVVFTSGQSVPVLIDGLEVGRIAVDDILPPIEPAAGGNGV